MTAGTADSVWFERGEAYACAGPYARTPSTTYYGRWLSQIARKTHPETGANAHKEVARVVLIHRVFCVVARRSRRAVGLEKALSPPAARSATLERTGLFPRIAPSAPTCRRPGAETGGVPGPLSRRPARAPPRPARDTC